MSNLKYKNFSFEKKQILTKDKIQIEGYLFTYDIDRVGDRILPDVEVVLPKYLPVLYQHKVDKVLGKVLETSKDDVGLKIVCELIKVEKNKNEFELVEKNLLGNFSVGFIPIEGKANEFGGYDYMKIEVVEASVVSVPANPNAEIIYQNLDFDKLNKLEKKLNEIYETLKSSLNIDNNKEINELIEKEKELSNLNVLNNPDKFVKEINEAINKIFNKFVN